MVIGGGTVYPELNFTLPQMVLSRETMPEVRGHYREIINGSLQRSASLMATMSAFLRGG